MESATSVSNVSNNEECSELKNIQYKTMLISGNLTSTLSKHSNSLLNLDKFLEDNKNSNKTEPWNKLDKTIKTKKLMLFAEKYTKLHELTEEENNLLVSFLKDCLDRKKFQRVKDVEYDKITSEIENIPTLFYNKPIKHFTLKNTDKRISTLKSLPPKKLKGTVKNKQITISVEDKSNKIESQSDEDN